MTTDASNLKNDLCQFCGTETWYRHGINRAVTFTEGVKFLADKAGAYWLVDEIAIIQPYNALIRAEPFQVWRLVVQAENRAILTCVDGEGAILFTKEIPFTDFPLPEIKLYMADSVLMLPSEY